MFYCANGTCGSLGTLAAVARLPARRGGAAARLRPAAAGLGQSASSFIGQGCDPNTPPPADELDILVRIQNLGRARAAKLASCAATAAARLRALPANASIARRDSIRVTTEQCQGAANARYSQDSRALRDELEALCAAKRAGLIRAAPAPTPEPVYAPTLEPVSTPTYTPAPEPFYQEPTEELAPTLPEGNGYPRTATIVAVGGVALVALMATAYLLTRTT
jgi:hypothetical protein